jgi:uncharacterized protein YllA (UPF0747 family)
VNTTSVPYHRLAGLYPPLFVDVVRGEPRAAALFAAPWQDRAGLLARARRAAGRGLEPQVLDRLRARHRDLGAPAESLAALDLLGRGGAAVVTGQQPAVGLGPLYNLYKAAGAIRLAREVSAAGVPCAAVFWNHSDDTRGGDGAAFPDRENRLREVPLPPDAEPGRPLYEAGSDEALRMFALALGQALPQTEFSGRVAELLLATHRGSVAESFSRALLAVLGREGLVVLEPRDLDGARASAVFEAHLREPGRLSAAVEAGRAAVRAAGYEDQLGREVGLDLFEMREGRRLRVEAPGTSKGRLSAGVALRPILQDAVLPTCAYVGGPAELAYQAALGAAYAAFGVEPPLVVPRPTATLMEPKVRRALGGEDPAEMLRGGGPTAGPEEAVLGRLEGLGGRWAGELRDALAPLGAAPALDRALEKTSGKVNEALGALGGRVREELARREETGRGRRARLDAHARPLGKLQERVFTPFYYAALFGPDVLGRVAALLDVRLAEHQCIEIL